MFHKNLYKKKTQLENENICLKLINLEIRENLRRKKKEYKLVKGRLIGENIRLVDGIMNYTKTKTKTTQGLIMPIDFEKALIQCPGNLFSKL